MVGNTSGRQSFLKQSNSPSAMNEFNLHLFSSAYIDAYTRHGVSTSCLRHL